MDTRIAQRSSSSRVDRNEREVTLLMKTLVLGLESADAGLLFGLDGVPVLRHLMDVGCYGSLESVGPLDSKTTWMCLATGQDPRSLSSVAGPTIWDYLACAGKPSILVGVPPASPPLKIRGISVGGIMTLENDDAAFT